MAMPAGIKAIDVWVNMNPPGGYRTDENLPERNSVRFRDDDSRDQSHGPLGYLFPGVGERTAKGTTPAEAVQLMKQAGVERAILSIPSNNPEPALKAIREHSDTFVGALRVDPQRGMEAVMQLERMVKEHGVKAIRLPGQEIQKPYNDKIYYPVYAKCVELDIVVMAPVGIPGPRVPGACQDPMAFDEVCWFFPDLKVVMSHGGEPWQFLCVKLLHKWPNLYFTSAAFSPKHFPQEIVYYMNTRGADKVMFGTDYPLLPWDRCMKEVKEMPLRDHVWPKFLRENAIKLFNL